MEYGDPMQQVFKDQCRSAEKQNGSLGVFLLWLRTILDLFYTAFLEHVTSPRASWGIMEPVPNKPLPWKGVFLILLPGLVYLFGQIAQMRGLLWYMVIYQWAGIFLMIPPLLVWMVQKRYPIWGLMPIGLFFHLAKERSSQWLISLSDALQRPYSASPTFVKISLFFQNSFSIPTSLLIAFVLLLSIALAALAWHYFRQHTASHSFWLWLGIFIVCALLKIISIYWEWLPYIPSLLINEDYQQILKFSMGAELLNLVVDLLVIFIGTLFISKHGIFTVLIFLGYLLPKILLGYNVGYLPEDYPTFFDTLSLLIIGYRALLALIAPVWIARSKNLAGQKTAFWVSFGLVFCITTFLQLEPWQTNYVENLWLNYGWYWPALELRELLALFSLIALTASIYHNIPIQPAQPDKSGQALNNSIPQMG